MIVILGLILLLAAVVVAVAGVFTNLGSAHALTNAFTAFGHHMTGSTGTLFLSGIVVGAVGVLGLGLLLAGARRTSRRGLTQSRRESDAAHRERDDAAGQRDSTPARTASTRGGDAPRDGELDPVGGHRSRPHLFGHRPAPR